MSWVKRREIPLVIGAVCGFTMIADYFLDIPLIAGAATDFTNWTMVLMAFSMMLGIVNLTMIYVRRASRGGTGTDNYTRFCSAWLVALMWVILVLGFVPPQTKHPAFQWVYNAFIFPVMMALYSSLAFFITTAAYRSFRARNFETGVFLVFGLLMIFYNSPIGQSLWTGFISIGDWILKVPNLAGRRAIIISSAIGSLVLGYRTLIGSETGWLARGERKSE